MKNITILVTALFLILSACCNNATENQKSEAGRNADNTYKNPILGGDYPDPSVLRVGSDFYMTHSSFEYYPGLLVWHSTDLIHWERLGYALNRYVGSVWAPDLVKVDDLYYIYFPAGGTNWVVTASNPAGPWSDPVDLQLQGFIDPGHLQDAEGNRYLYLSNGYIAPLSPDGLSKSGPVVKNYEGWLFPSDWSTECFCLESPKSTVRHGYFYLTTAEGGTAGPATSHMVVSARADSPYGPFENSPYKPIVHTQNRGEKWWSQGHGTLVDDVDGNWWIMYHGYMKNFHTLGRQTLMLPVEWTADDWFRVPEGQRSEDPIAIPAGQNKVTPDELSDNFDGESLGLQWQFFKDYQPERIKLLDGKLIFSAAGSSFDNSSPILVNAGDTKYEVTVEFKLSDGVQTGLCLYYDEKANMRIQATPQNFSVYIKENRKISVPNTIGDHGFLRILNDENEVSFYYSLDGSAWNRVERSLDATGYNHNVFGQFLSLRAGIYAFGTGEVVIDNFVYRKL